MQAPGSYGFPFLLAAFSAARPHRIARCPDYTASLGNGSGIRHADVIGNRAIPKPRYLDGTTPEDDNLPGCREADMTQQEFDALVFRLEQVARSRPRSYALRVLLLALLGNAYICAILLILLALLVALAASLLVFKAVAVKLIVILGFFLWVVLKALWVRIPPPDGEGIGPQDAPALFSIIAEVQQKLGAPRFHKVLVNDDFNAGVVQAPRLGVLASHRNYLLITLPLLK